MARPYYLLASDRTWHAAEGRPIVGDRLLKVRKQGPRCPSKIYWGVIQALEYLSRAGGGDGLRGDRRLR
jgi:hypothetical protein